MTFRLPGPLPASYDPSGANRNPSQSMPMPRPQAIPVGGWNAQQTIIANFTASPGEGEHQESFWRGPIFDLQPQMRNLMPQSGVGNGNAQKSFNASPIWSLAPGTGSREGKLRIFISNLRSATTSLTNMEFYASEFGHPCTSGLVQQVLPETNITSHINTDVNSCLLSFFPNGQRSPLRFWQLRLRIVKTLNDGLALPTYNITCGYY